MDRGRTSQCLRQVYDGMQLQNYVLLNWVAGRRLFGKRRWAGLARGIRTSRHRRIGQYLRD